MGAGTDERAAAPARARAATFPVLVVLAGAALVAQAYGLYRPTGPQPGGVPGLDKVLHALGFAVPLLLVLAAGRAGLRDARRRVTDQFVAVTVAVFALHAVVSELVQGRFYRHRTGDPYDVLADGLGIALGVVLDRALTARPRRGS